MPNLTTSFSMRIPMGEIQRCIMIFFNAYFLAPFSCDFFPFVFWSTVFTFLVYLCFIKQHFPDDYRIWIIKDSNQLDVINSFIVFFSDFFNLSTTLHFIQLEKNCNIINHIFIFSLIIRQKTVFNVIHLKIVIITV